MDSATSAVKGSNDMDSTYPNNDSNPAPAKLKRGFAVMSPDRVKEISRMGGIAAHAQGTAHRFTREEARAAGRLGGIATHAKRQAVQP